ncbi:hypothetical protein [Neorhodopirellula pilleata]|uniref:Type 4 fimbrial biogenesis protein PilX N-terminal domain-containing protein n=1 Tax=Neorhodopirellula pilleata TaxID=2714738 RepID=A0A5C6AW13_9BACT|nr:hypothetical protein [Neorhodopirellula pilleata]TWU03242.1 hypothetical protein Pla100_01600 [Neorhodopirellula pilleata]
MNLIEVTASTILVVLILLGSVQATTGMLGNEVIADAQLQAEWHANDLLAEITAVPFVSISGYDGLSQSPPTRSGGITLPGLAGWSVSVGVADVDPAAPDNVVVSTPESPAWLKRVTVTMSDPDGGTFSRSRLVSRIPRSQNIVGSIDSLSRLEWSTSTSTHRMNVPLINLPGQ